MDVKISLQSQCNSQALNYCENSIVADNSQISIKNGQLSKATNCENFDAAESPKVIYFNPDYEVKKHVIHVNPNVHVKTSIHVNPKLNCKRSMHEHQNVGSKTSSIYVNPKIVKNIDVMQRLQGKESNIDNSAENFEPNTLQGNVQKSIHVNPKLLRKLATTRSQKSSTVLEKKAVTEQINYNVCSKFNIKNVFANQQFNNSKIIPPPSGRKLVRVKRNSRGSSSMSIITPIKVRRRLSSTEIKLARVNRNILLPSTSRYDQKNSRLKFVNSKNKVSHYNVDRTVVLKGKRGSGFARTKTLSSSMKLVSIGGISYKSSKNQLVRRTNTSSSKKKGNISNKDQDHFFIASNGKALRRLDATRECQTQVNQTKYVSHLNRTILIKKSFNTILKQNVKSSISNKVKQRSIQILRNKMRKNNQPCLFFKKFGYCANQTNGTCHKVHDKKQVALCRNFLQGKCLLGSCKLSHDVGPEKMPTCKYFLEGCCTRDACPYLHVKVSEKTPICRQFLQGYCEKGNECKQRHIYACPEFEKAGICSKGKQCPYPHKSRTPKISRTLQTRKDSFALGAPDSTENVCYTIESKKRYYDDSCCENLEKKKERMLKNVKIMKALQTTTTTTTTDHSSEKIGDNEITIINNCSTTQQDLNNDNERLKRPPIGHLPSYIPIN